MLHIECRPDIDACVQQFLDVLPALGMARPRFTLRNVRVREFIDEDDRRRAAQCRIEVEFAPGNPLIAHLQEWQGLEALEQSLGLDAPMRLDVTDGDIGAAGLRYARRLQHREGLADAGRCAKENMQATASSTFFLALHICQQFIRVRTIIFSH